MQLRKNVFSILTVILLLVFSIGVNAEENLLVQDSSNDNSKIDQASAVSAFSHSGFSTLPGVLTPTSIKTLTKSVVGYSLILRGEPIKYCSGVLISKDTMITTATCMFNTVGSSRILFDSLEIHSTDQASLSYFSGSVNLIPVNWYSRTDPNIIEVELKGANFRNYLASSNLVDSISQLDEVFNRDAGNYRYISSTHKIYAAGYDFNLKDYSWAEVDSNSSYPYLFVNLPNQYQSLYVNGLNANYNEGLNSDIGSPTFICDITNQNCLLLAMFAGSSTNEKLYVPTYLSKL